MKAAPALAIAAGILGGCGYRVAGRGDLLPKTIRTIAVPAFSNASARYKLTDVLAAAVTREFLTRTRYEVVADPAQADAELNGAVVNFYTVPTVFDPSGRVTAVQVSVWLKIALRERATGRVLYQRDNFEVHDRYEVSTYPRTYIEETDIALERLSRDVARSLVTAILENF